MAIYLLSPEWSVWSLGRLASSWLNPINAGSGYYDIGMLNWHLWFIAPFLAVTTFLPFLAKIRLSVKIPLWIFMLGFALLIHLISLARFQGSELIQNTIFYSIWATLGYHLAKSKIGFTRRDYLPVLFISLTILISPFILSPGLFSLNMQDNKFPPNSVFFIFSCAWVSFLLMLTPLLNAQVINKLSTRIWFRPFILNGYSIYLWQGAGYTAAVYLGNKLDLSIFIVWFGALFLTVFFGFLAGPIERLRIRF